MRATDKMLRLTRKDIKENVAKLKKQVSSKKIKEIRMKEKISKILEDNGIKDEHIGYFSYKEDKNKIFAVLNPFSNILVYRKIIFIDLKTNECYESGISPTDLLNKDKFEYYEYKKEDKNG